MSETISATGKGNGSARRGVPATLLIGVGLLAALETLLVVDVVRRGGFIVPHGTLAEPEGLLGGLARLAAIDFTPLAWLAYIVLLDGVLAMRWGAEPQAGSPVRRRARRFAATVLLSVPIWVFFDWINFSFMGAWEYHHLPEGVAHRTFGYFVAFGAICPGMFLSAELASRLGASRLRFPAFRLGRWANVALIAVGGAMMIVPFLVRDPVANFALWPAPMLLLDPLNDLLGAPSVLGDWRRGRIGRAVSLLVGGLICGFLWEFWNYWAVAKWTYDLPFLGPLEPIKLFEMPLVGFTGFLPFALACWAMTQTALWPLQRISRRLIEPLPEDRLM